MTRFMQELNGNLGVFWQKEAQKELERVEADLAAKKITIDENGVARNCIGRVALVTEKVDVEATEAARNAEVAKELESYRASKRAHSPEEKVEMRATFGSGTKVVDILSGEQFTI